MIKMDQNAIENLLSKLDNENYLFPPFKIKYNDNNNIFTILGRGGYATVYEMSDREDPTRRCALKVIGLEKHTVTLEGFWESVRLQQKLSENSPHITKVFAARALAITLDQNGNICNVVDETEYLHETTTNESTLHLQFILMEKLDSIITKDKYKNTILLRKELREEKEVINFAMQIGQALMFAHANHILHRDIKLENIFWDAKEKRYKLGDFDIAKYVKTGHAETVIYTNGYGAPEIEMQLTKSYNETADIYSFGITLYLLLNELSFPGSTGYFVNQIQYNPEFVFPAPKNASENIARVIRKMCCFRRNERYQSVSEVLGDCGDFCKEDTVITGDENFQYLDVETETYRQETENTTNEKIISEQTKTKAELRLEQRNQLISYSKGCFKHCIILILLFLLAMVGVQAELPMMLEWGFWIVPIILILVKDITIIISYAIAIGMWAFYEMTNGLNLLEFIANKNVGWIFISLVIAEVVRLASFKFESQQSTKNELDRKISIYVWICWLMILGGVICKIQQFREVWDIPTVVENMHFIRTGVLAYVIILFSGVWSDDEEGESE